MVGAGNVKGSFSWDAERLSFSKCLVTTNVSSLENTGETSVEYALGAKMGNDVFTQADGKKNKNSVKSKTKAPNERNVVRGPSEGVTCAACKSSNDDAKL